MKTLIEFQELISYNCWRNFHRKTFIKYPSSPKRMEFLEDLYKKIQNQTYMPSEPRGYVVYNKHNKVARIVPVFSLEDNCFYYYTIKCLEKTLAVNHVDGTYGGYLLENEIKKKEVEDFEIESAIPFSSAEFSYNREAWIKAWRDFSTKTFVYSRPSHLKYFLKFDIANFYDSINLDILEKKIRASADSTLNDEVELLLYFLGYSNKKLNFYLKQTVSIPQDEVGDCSRLLANFYLQDYDKRISDFCKENDAVYMRYADDQIIMASNKKVAEKILLYASIQLSRINLNINSGKVIPFKSKKSHDKYWAFDIFDLLTDTKDFRKIKKGVKLYFNRDKKDFRWQSVLRRILYLDINKIGINLRSKVMAEITQDDFLLDSSASNLIRIYSLVSSIPEKKQFLDDLEVLSENTLFNKFHYTLLLAKEKGLSIAFSRKLKYKIKKLDQMFFGQMFI